MEDKYQAAIERVLERLLDHDLAVNLSKSEFHVQETVFLGYIVNGLEIKMDSAKVKTIEEWAVP